MSQRKFWAALSSNWLGELAIRAPQLAVDLLVLQLLSPWQLGVWIGAKAAFQFGSALSSVPLCGLDIEYSYAIGRSDTDSAARVAGGGAIATFALTVVTVLLLAPAVFFDGFRNNLIQGANRFEFAAFLALVAVQGGYNFFITHLRNQLRFAHVNLVIIVGNTLILAMAAIAAPRWGVTGVMVSYALAMAACCLIWVRWTELRWPAPVETRKLLVALCRTGAGLAAVSLSICLLRLISRWLIGQQFGEVLLGQYGVAATAAGVVLLAGGATGRVVMQFAARAVGAKMQPQEQLLQFALLPGLGIAGAGVMASFAVSAAARWLIPLWAPQHAGALSVLRPVLIAATILGVAFVIASALRAQLRQSGLVLAALGAAVLQWLLMTVAAFDGWSFTTVVGLEIISFSGFLVGLLLITPIDWRRRTVFAVSVAAAMLLGTTAMQSADTLAPVSGIGSALANVMLAVAVFSPWSAFAYVAIRMLRRPSLESASDEKQMALSKAA